MRSLSKSKLIAFRQCPKRFWLEIHHPELRHDSSATEASFEIGFQVGDIARQLYDPQQQGETIEIKQLGFDGAFARSQELLNGQQPIFEAGFRAAGALAFADVMLPKQGQWDMIEVKSSTSVKDYHLDDMAIQVFVAQAAGVNLNRIALAHINSAWVYPGHGDYRGLLKEVDLREQALSRQQEVQHWLQQAQQLCQQAHEPAIAPGPQCQQPFACGFSQYCQTQLEKPQCTNHSPPFTQSQIEGFNYAHRILS